jgi:hypothetical protein
MDDPHAMPYDCSSHYARSALALSAVTRNSTLLQTYVNFTHIEHTTH